MHAEIAADPELLTHFEGVVRKTAAITAKSCEEEFEDICQVFRVTVWKALLSFDAQKSRTTSHLAYEKQRDQYVFSCLKNRAKDFLKQVRRNWSFIEDMTVQGNDTEAHDSFESRYLQVSEEQVFQACEESAPLVPSTLGPRERKIVALLWLELDNGEIADEMGLNRQQVGTLVRGIRTKMADFAPVGQADTPPVIPFPIPVGEPLPLAA